MTLSIPDPEVKASNFFCWKELLWLNQWSRMANEEDGLTEEILNNLNDLALKMDKVRLLLGCPMNVHCGYRPPSYSVLVGGNATDPHTQGRALDFDLGNIMTCEQAQAKLMSELVTLNLRMERGTVGWIHLDTCPVLYNRYFNP